MASPAHSTTRIHAPLFFVDHKDLNGCSATLSEFVQNEEEYDKSMCEAQMLVYKTLDRPISSNRSFLLLLDKVQYLATIHIQERDDFRRGRVPMYDNQFTLSRVTSDVKGVERLIKKIWIKKQNFSLIFKDKKNHLFLLEKEKFTWINTTNNSAMFLYENTSYGTIRKTVLEKYSQTIESKQVVVRITYTRSEREAKALAYMERYFEKIEQACSDRDKILCIARLMQNLLQLHLYCDGNGRTIFLMANLLLMQNKLDPFYPSNMCIFDANGVDQMISEVVFGQIRFKSFFGDIHNLMDGIKLYFSQLEELEKLVKEDYTHEAVKHLKWRNFEALLAESSHNSDIYKFLVANHETFNLKQP